VPLSAPDHPTPSEDLPLKSPRSDTTRRHPIIAVQTGYADTHFDTHTSGCARSRPDAMDDRLRVLGSVDRVGHQGTAGPVLLICRFSVRLRAGSPLNPSTTPAMRASAPPRPSGLTTILTTYHGGSGEDCITRCAASSSLVRQHVRVGVQRDTHLRVPQHLHHRSHVDAPLSSSVAAACRRSCRRMCGSAACTKDRD